MEINNINFMLFSEINRYYSFVYKQQLFMTLHSISIPTANRIIFIVTMGTSLKASFPNNN